MSLMPRFAPIVVLLFLGAVLACMLAAAALLYGLVRNQPAVKRWAALAILAIPAGYATLLLGASLTSRDKVLTPGGRKYFCEIDCHLAYSIDHVRTAKTLGNPAQPERAAGTFYVIALETWFDESTISPMRPRDALLYPNPRQVYIQDASGRKYAPSGAAERALESTGVASTPLTRPLIPGQSYVTQLVFDLPDGVREPLLYVGDADPVSAFLIGHEESQLHHKIYFRL